MRKALLLVMGLTLGCSETKAGSDAAAPSGEPTPSGTAADTAAPALSATADASSEATADAAAPDAADAAVPKGTVACGGAGVAGGAVSNATSVVARLRSKFRRCYQQGLQSDPNMRGSLTLTLKVGPHGEVTGVGGGGGGSLGTIVPCLKAAAKTAHFAPPQGGGAIVSVPLTFTHD